MKNTEEYCLSPENIHQEYYFRNIRISLRQKESGDPDQSGKSDCR